MSDSANLFHCQMAIWLGAFNPPLIPFVRLKNNEYSKPQSAMSIRMIMIKHILCGLPYFSDKPTLVIRSASVEVALNP